MPYDNMFFVSAGELTDQQLRAFFETFRLPLLLPSSFFPNDTARYAIRGCTLQGYFTHKKTRLPRTLPQAYA